MLLLYAGFEQLSHYVIELYSFSFGCHDPNDEIEVQGQRFANKTFIVDKVGEPIIIPSLTLKFNCYLYHNIIMIIMNYLQSESSLIVRAKTPMDLPLFRMPRDCDYVIVVRC